MKLKGNYFFPLFLIAALFSIVGGLFYLNAHSDSHQKRMLSQKSNPTVMSQNNPAASEIPDEITEEDDNEKENTSFIFGIIIPYFTPKIETIKSKLESSLYFHSSLKNPLFIFYHSFLI